MDESHTLYATDVSFCGSGGKESSFICTFGPELVLAAERRECPYFARAAAASWDTIARTPDEMPPGYSRMCLIHRGVALCVAADAPTAVTAIVAARRAQATSVRSVRCMRSPFPRPSPPN